MDDEEDEDREPGREREQVVPDQVVPDQRRLGCKTDETSCA